MNSFLTRWGNYSRRGNYSREETIWGYTVYFFKSKLEAKAHLWSMTKVVHIYVWRIGLNAQPYNQILVIKSFFLLVISCYRLNPIFVQKNLKKFLQITIIYLTKFREENENQRAKSLDNWWIGEWITNSISRGHSLTMLTRFLTFWPPTYLLRVDIYEGIPLL